MVCGIPLWKYLLPIIGYHNSQCGFGAVEIPIVVLWNTIIGYHTSQGGFRAVENPIVVCGIPLWKYLLPIIGYHNSQCGFGAVEIPIVILWNAIMEMPTFHVWVSQFTMWVSKLKVAHCGFVEYHYGSAYFPCMGITIHKVGLELQKIS